LPTDGTTSKLLDDKLADMSGVMQISLQTHLNVLKIMDTCTKTIVFDKLDSDNDYKLTVVQLKEKLRALARDESDREQETVTSKFSV